MQQTHQGAPIVIYWTLLPYDSSPLHKLKRLHWVLVSL